MFIKKSVKQIHIFDLYEWFSQKRTPEEFLSEATCRVELKVRQRAMPMNIYSKTRIWANTFLKPLDNEAAMCLFPEETLFYKLLC